MTDNIFGNPEGSQPAAPQQAPSQESAKVIPEPQAPAQVTDPNSVFANQLAGIMTEDGRQKYADVPTALASINHAQEHIRSLAAKNAELEAELQKRLGMDDVLRRIEQSQQPTSEQPSVKGLDESAVEALLEQRLTQREQAKVAQANQATVVKALTDKYGDKAEEVFINKAKELGVDVGYLTQIGLRSPQAALAYFGGAPAHSSNPVSPGNNTTAFRPNQSPDTSYMDIFTGGANDLVNKWKKAKS